jgi:hypothetical protein
MKEFTLAEDSLPFNFFEEIELSFQEIAVECIKEGLITLSHSECESIFEVNYDLFSEKMYDARISEAISDYCVGEEEIDESTGAWGYFHYEIEDGNKAKLELGMNVKILFDEVVDDLKKRFKKLQLPACKQNCFTADATQYNNVYTPTLTSDCSSVG